MVLWCCEAPYPLNPALKTNRISLFAAWTIKSTVANARAAPMWGFGALFPVVFTDKVLITGSWRLSQYSVFHVLFLMGFYYWTHSFVLCAVLSMKPAESSSVPSSGSVNTCVKTDFSPVVFMNLIQIRTGSPQLGAQTRVGWLSSSFAALYRKWCKIKPRSQLNTNRRLIVKRSKRRPIYSHW